MAAGTRTGPGKAGAAPGMSGSSANRLRIPRPVPSRPRDPSQPRARLVGAPPRLLPPPPGAAAGRCSSDGEVGQQERCSSPGRRFREPGAPRRSGKLRSPAPMLPPGVQEGGTGGHWGHSPAALSCPRCLTVPGSNRGGRGTGEDVELL